MNEWWAALTALEKIFVILAFPFTVFTLIQIALELLGFGSHHASADGNVSADAGSLGHDAAGFGDHFTFFSIRNMIYFLMMFGWTGLACSKANAPAWATILIAVIAGLLTTIIIGWIFYIFNKLQESGNVKITSAVGSTGTVYLKIPPERDGTGVIQIVIQGVTQELNAMTDGDGLETGKLIEVAEILSGNIALVKLPKG